MAYSAHKDFYFMDGDQGGGFGDNSTICNDTDEESVSSSSTVVLVKQTVKYASIYWNYY